MLEIRPNRVLACVCDSADGITAEADESYDGMTIRLRRKRMVFVTAG